MLMGSQGNPLRLPLLPPAILPLAGGIFLIAGFGQNWLLALFAIIVLVIGSLLLWRPGEAPILLFVFGYQWLQASISVFHANWLGVRVPQLTAWGGDPERAIVLSLLGLLALACGMRLGAGRWRPGDGYLARIVASSQPIPVWFKLYAIAFAAAFLIQSLAWKIPGLSQPLLALANLKWAFFFMLAYASFVQPAGGNYYFLAAFALELALGIGGYFSDFKTVMFFTLFAGVASGVRVSPHALIGFGILGAMLVTFGLVWTAIKGEYRSFVSHGERAQIVEVGYVDRFNKIGQLVGELDSARLQFATDQLVRRLSYVEFFGAVLDYVPRLAPHEDGALWWDAVSRPFMPRILFADKSVIDDSERTNKYTGFAVAGAGEGTSISIGYMGESYIDFGEVGMMVPIFLLGLLYGSLYRWMLNSRGGRGILGMAIASGVLFVGIFLESSITKLFGGLIVALLAGWLIVQLITPRFFPWTQVEPGR